MEGVNSSIRESDKSNIQEVFPAPVFNNEYLNLFCAAISDETLINKISFKQIYESKITYFTPFLQSEVMRNLSHLSSYKKDNYLSFVIDKIARTPYYRTKKSKMIEFLMDYDLTMDEFPNLSNPELNTLLSEDYFTQELTIEEHENIYFTHQQFYRFAAKIEADIMIHFLEDKLFSESKTVNNSEYFDQTDNSNQLSVNQAVILLDKLGIFSTDILEKVPNTRKAKLISQLIGKNGKNIKTAIERLELKPKDISCGYQKDLDKIQQILDKLE